MGAADTAAMRPLNAGAAPKKPAAEGKAAPSSTGSAGLRIIKFFAALALVPACVGFSLGTHDHFLSTWARLNYAIQGPGMLLKYFAAGALVFGIFAVLLWRPVVIYVFGHELVHAVATWLCLGKVSNLSASARGGQVTSSKSNTFIRLAPYCVPLYACIAVGVYAAMNQWWRPMSPYLCWLALGLGFFYAFHIGFTLWSLRRDQPDLKPDGWFFSLVIIYMANLAIFALLLGFLLSGDAHSAWDALRDSATAGWHQTQTMYRNIGSAAEDLVNR